MQIEKVQNIAWLVKTVTTVSAVLAMSGQVLSGCGHSPSTQRLVRCVRRALDLRVPCHRYRRKPSASAENPSDL